MAIAIQHKRGVAANRPVLAAGELYYATDTGQLWVGPTPVVVGQELITNFAAAQQSQVTVAGTVYYITNSNLNIPATVLVGLKIGSMLKWRIVLNKTAAGTGTFVIGVHMGTAGSISDTKVVTQSIGTQTAAVDSVILDIMLVFTAVGAGTASFYWTICPFQKAATATGFGVAVGATGLFSGTVGSLNSTTANLKFGISFSSTTGTPTITVPLVQAEALGII